MGLDMYLKRHKKAEEVCYWRKADAIKDWFVEQGYPSDGNCDHLEVTKDMLEDLVDTCKQIMADHSLAEQLLPINSYCEQEYDEDYFSDIEFTVTQVQKVIDETDWDTESVYYTDWW